MLKIGPYEIQSVTTGTIRLDGGAMFGVVPKVLWQNVTDVDEVNRILLHTRTLLAVDRAAGRVVLVDSGCGTKWTPKQADRYAITYDPHAIPLALRSSGLTEEAVTDIVITHLHFDHNGGLTEWVDDPLGPTQLRYPNALHWIHKRHWEHARNPNNKDRVSFIVADFAVLADSARLRLVEGDQPESPFPEVTWFVSHGHTPYQLHPIFGRSGQRLMFVGDIVPTIAHLRLGWVMAYDLLPMTTISEKQEVFRRCFEDGLMLAFPHEPSTGGVMIEGRMERPIVTRALPL